MMECQDDQHKEPQQKQQQQEEQRHHNNQPIPSPPDDLRIATEGLTVNAPDFEEEKKPSPTTTRNTNTLPDEHPEVYQNLDHNHDSSEDFMAATSSHGVPLPTSVTSPVAAAAAVAAHDAPATTSSVEDHIVYVPVEPPSPAAPVPPPMTDTTLQVTHPPLPSVITGGSRTATKPSSSRQAHVLLDAQGNEKSFGSALGLLTRKFMDMLMASGSGTIDMNVSAEILGVPKRRIYDITNVLEGVGIIEKRSKNTVAWKGSEAILGPSIDPAAKEQIDACRDTISQMTREEERLDRWLSQLQRNQVVSTSVRADDVVQAIFYPTHGPVEQQPTRDTILDASGKPKCVLIAVQAPFGSYAHLVPDPAGQPERQLYVGSLEGLARYDLPVSPPPPAGSPHVPGLPYRLTTGRVFRTARKDDRTLSVHVLPTYWDEKDAKLKTTGPRPLNDDRLAEATQPAPVMYSKTESQELLAEAVPMHHEDVIGDDEDAKRQRSSSWDVAESMANDEGVSEFFDEEPVV